ncbi:zinc finger protein 280B isoform X1 [Physeter macrocephalus]|uniref:Zinc finger protein 280B isoform X1 n=1 Tax=Physeter macrocephalus TaxID=9755 RepID=A0A2Y9SGB2_PHYMC|nr:zinc finger protein 280B isoform X1 [Physeter catodon]XP_054936326.1 zinc finger protein 280B isoform X1 [Physeter catodon]XP_054936327.1 zinc finger protein 280B isoform X1 [Physeter catodon]XP_054936328.1 zinc finger protein 280B isoform X1 [Physeter catodon]|eukprot:XP_007131017.2 zinc finger protein 280B [Physeter catodon]
MEPPCMLCEEQEPEPQKSIEETKQVDDEDAELIFVGVEHVNEDAELIFVGMTSNSKPVVSNILNRVTPGSCSRRKQSGHFRKDNAHKLEPVSHVMPTSEAMTVLPVSDSESRSTDSPIIIEPLSKPDYKNNSPQVVPISSSELCSPPLITFTSSLQHPVGAALSTGGMNKSPRVTKQLSTSETNSTNPKRPKLSNGIIGGHSLALAPSGIFHTMTAQQSTPSDSVHTSLSHVQNGEPCPTAFPKDSVRCRPISPFGENGLAKTDFSSLASQNKTVDPMKGNLIVLLRDFYYGQHTGDGQPEQKTHTAFKCLSCLKVLKNVKFMNHMKHHLELEKQRGDSWKNHTTCQHCHRQFPTPFQLQCHIESVHTFQEPSAVCKICELSFETDQVLLQHMKDNHKPGEMPYVCQVCNYRSSAFTDVETHFRTYHENTKNLLCPFCLKIFKTATPYMCHYRGHWEKSVHQCSKCRLQFLTFKEKMEHKTQCHQMFKKPKQLEGLPPETKVVIQVSLGPLEPGSVELASITVNTSDSEPSPPRSKSRISKKPH